MSSTDTEHSMRLWAQERLILAATETIAVAMQEQQIGPCELAHRLRKSRRYVERILAGEKDISLRQLSDILYALDTERYTVEV